jgi:type IV secretion system protein VirD4
LKALHVQSQRQQLYVIPRTQGDITRFVWVAFLIFGLVTALTFVLVTQYTAWQFRFHPTLGSPAAILGQTRIYWPWDILIWIFRYFRPDSSPDVCPSSRRLKCCWLEVP